MSEVKKAFDYGIAGLVGAVFGIAVREIKESAIECSCKNWKIALVIVGILFLISLGYIIYTEFFE
jgi:hypothetical protein